MLEQLTGQLARLKSLPDEEVAAAVAQLVDERVPVETKADFLTALSHKGETSAEIAAFARALLGMAVQPSLDGETRAGWILDVCGTGGDRLGTFNISTTVALIV